MASLSACSTPVNTLNREALTVLITNNILNKSVEFPPDCETMETDSPVRNPNLKIVSKKLFQSPISELTSPNSTFIRKCDRSLKAKKRTLNMSPESGKTIKSAYVAECDRDKYTVNNAAGMRKRTLLTLFHDKEYSMDCDFGY